MSIKDKVQALSKIMKGGKMPNKKTKQKTEDTKPEPVVERRPKILVFDIETANFSANFGECLMFGYRWFGDSETEVVRIDDFEGWDELPIELRDYYLIQYISDLITEADVLVGHYSTRFDFPFLQTRCIVHELQPLPEPIHIDTWRIARYQLKITSNKLKTLARALNCEHQKSELPMYMWRRSHAHDPEALTLMADYCALDVDTTHDVIQRLLPIAKKLPCRNLFSGELICKCPSCGSEDLKENGTAYTKVNSYVRYQCKQCGKWLRGRKTLTDKVAQRYV